jgi:endonuclease/exonuclease/phosphatase family metal-dependent hydrolase
MRGGVCSAAGRSRAAYSLLAGALYVTLQTQLVDSQAAPNQSVSVQPARAQTAPPRPVIARWSPRVLRVVTWNIGANSITPLGRSVDRTSTSRPAAFGRVMRALDPDIVCLQEYSASTDRLRALFDALRPLGAGRGWHTAQSNGNTIISRYPLGSRGSSSLHSVFVERSHAYANVDLPDSLAPIDPVVVCAHLQSGGGAGNASFRKRHAEAIAHDLEARAAAESGSRPVIVMGDMNAVDRTVPDLLSIRAPANAGFPLRDVVAQHNGVGPERYTWRDDRQRFAPSVLDYILFTERAFTVRHAFVLNTMTLDSAVLLAFGLKRNDTMRDPARGTHDHLPVVADLEMVRATSEVPPGTARSGVSRPP